VENTRIFSGQFFSKEGLCSMKFLFIFIMCILLCVTNVYMYQRVVQYTSSTHTPRHRNGNTLLITIYINTFGGTHDIIRLYTL
jgi:uncharacterized protein (UPF0333 family)